MIVGVTGATGFVGRHITQQLMARGHQVRALARRPARARLPAAVQIVPGSLSDEGALATLVAGAAAVVHLVGIIVGSEADFAAVHTTGTRAVVNAARAAGVRRFVHMSALGARDEPGATAYHRTKAAAEVIVRESGMSHVMFRPAIVSGPGNAPIAVLARLHRFAPLVPIFGSGDFRVQPVWVGDVAQAFALAVEGVGDGLYELGGPVTMTYREFVQAIGRATGHPRPTFRLPLGLVRLGARLATPLGPLAPITSDQLQMLSEGSVTRENALQRVFGIQPLSFEEGLKRYVSPRRVS